MPVRGTCPSLWEPMASGDGLLLRVKPPLGRLGAAAARALGAACARHGNGAIELTSRGNLQCRGFTAASAAAFADRVVSAGLASADPAAERRRTVLAPAMGGPALDQLAAAVERALESAADLAALPAKFGVAVDDGTMPSSDIVVRPGRVAIGDRAAATDDPAGAVLRLARAFLAAGGGRRMADLVGRVGAASILSAAGLGAGVPWAEPPPAPGPVGPIEGGICAGLPFGAFDAAVLAGLAERGDGVLRLTPWRSVVVAGAGRGALDAAAVAGLIVSPDDPRRRVHACPGAPACRSASVETRPLAARLRPAPGAAAHVSGCDKGCAHPGPAALTLVGRAGRFDLVRDGPASAPPVRRGLDPAEAIVA